MSAIRFIVAATAALALSGCNAGLSTTQRTSTSTVTAAPSTITRTVTSPTPPMNVALRNWLDMTQDHMQAIVRAAESVGPAADASDITTLHSACSQMHDAIEGLQGHMPTPDPELTKVMQSALSDYDAGTHFCIAATEDIDINEARHSVTFLQSADNYMHQASAIIDRNFGTSGSVFG